MTAATEDLRTHGATVGHWLVDLVKAGTVAHGEVELRMATGSAPEALKIVAYAERQGVQLPSAVAAAVDAIETHAASMPRTALERPVYRGLVQSWRRRWHPMDGNGIPQLCDEPACQACSIQRES